MYLHIQMICMPSTFLEYHKGIGCLLLLLGDLKKSASIQLCIVTRSDVRSVHSDT